jgi:iron complex outermembrane receptor protein
MVSKTFLTLSASVFALIAASHVQAQTSQAAQAEAANGNEIVVTASKREEKLQNVASSITALSGSKLETLGVVSFRDYATLVPGLSQRDAGAPGLGTVIIRGLNTGPQQTTNTAGYYIDDAPFSASGFLSVAASQTPEPELAEIDHIEVLKGPQGTLYGAGSLGGLVRVVTKKPNLQDFSGSARAELSTTDGGAMGYMVRGSVNVPLVADKVAIQATGFYRKVGGFADNIGTGHDNVNDSTIKGGRIALRAKPTERLTIDLSGTIQNIDNGGYAYQDVVAGTFNPLYGRDKYSNFLDFGSSMRYKIANATVAYETDLGTFTGVGNYADYRVAYSLDGTSTYLAGARATATPFIPVLFPGQTINTVLPANSLLQGYFSPGTKKWTGETRFTSRRLGAFEFIVGGFYTSEKSSYPVYLYNYTAAKVARTDFPVVLHSTSLSDYQEYAAFGNLTFYVNDQIDVTGGVRYAHNKQVNETGGPGSTTYFIPRATVDFPSSDNSFSYLATARWRPASNISLYVRAASGYRPGGPQTNPAPPAGAQTTVEPDKVWNYEGGVKGSFLHGAFTYDVSVYHIDWSKIQLNSLANGIVLQGNGGEAKVDGWEAQFSAHPAHYTTFTANLGHTNARITAITAGTAAVIGARVGDKLPLTPKYTVALLADQQIPLAGDMMAGFGATLRYQSTMPNGYGALVGSALIPQITTVDLRGNLTFGRYSIDARVANLTNAQGFPQVSGASAVVIRPRTFTVGATVKF